MILVNRQNHCQNEIPIGLWKKHVNVCVALTNDPNNILIIY